MKKIAIIIAVLALIGLALAYMGYQRVMQPNISPAADGRSLYLPTGSTLASLRDSLVSLDALISASAFDQTAQLMKLNDSSIKPGHYKLSKDWSNRTLINRLRSGNQEAVSLVINNVRSIEDLIGSIAKQVEPDSAALAAHFLAPKTLAELGYTAEEVLSLCIPNTYHVWWNSSPAKILDRLKAEHEKWWSSKDRKAQAERIGLSPKEVYTLASIVDKETNLKKEKKRVAGVYYNRIQRGIPLQADPTVVFASGQYDLRRVLNKHLAIDSPYNTYMYPGLPPGPIYMPTQSGLEAALHPENHKYIYFCAAPGYQGEHLFAKTLTQHNANARQYHRWLNKEGIR